MKRGVKIGLICGTVALLALIIGLVVYINFFSRTEYRIVGLDGKTDFTAKDFAKNSELKFYKNGTFRVRIEHEELGLVLTGIGTYTVDHNVYKLTFVQAYGRDTNDTVVDITYESDAITCKRSGNRFKFTDHHSQIYYFG